jgi:hypothetical protein
MIMFAYWYILDLIFRVCSLIFFKPFFYPYYLKIILDILNLFSMLRVDLICFLKILFYCILS